MTTGFRAFPPIGQNDNASCWAACLSWWLKANSRPPSTQNQLIVEFASLAAQDGTITMDAFQRIAATPRFKLQLAKFDINGIQQMRDVGQLPITIAPNIIVWNKFLTGPGIIGMHMNAVFDQRSTGGGFVVTCMEPFFPEDAKDGRRTGQFIDRDVGFFLKASPIMIGAPL